MRRNKNKSAFLVFLLFLFIGFSYSCKKQVESVGKLSVNFNKINLDEVRLSNLNLEKLNSYLLEANLSHKKDTLFSGKNLLEIVNGKTTKSGDVLFKSDEKDYRIRFNFYKYFDIGYIYLCDSIISRERCIVIDNLKNTIYFVGLIESKIDCIILLDSLLNPKFKIRKLEHFIPDGSNKLIITSFESKGEELINIIDGGFKKYFMLEDYFSLIIRKESTILNPEEYNRIKLDYLILPWRYAYKDSIINNLYEETTK